ncbi:ring finger protein [Reticulomyxa filosa]|uniref:Ring finger protein n=1 Tax=Reticulomyxa filosa TaxID=46433 RepID=X6MKI8_RETFI|nr:ring finger protein [Reticulomyxa filosa]|eukprot:ETO13957.1 ring finger protein [Reticulomyxa filosa]
MDVRKRKLSPTLTSTCKRQRLDNTAEDKFSISFYLSPFPEEEPQNTFTPKCKFNMAKSIQETPQMEKNGASNVSERKAKEFKKAKLKRIITEYEKSNNLAISPTVPIEFDLNTSPILVGRDPEKCELVLHSTARSKQIELMISRQVIALLATDTNITIKTKQKKKKKHAELMYENGQWYVKDLNSTNGIHVNDTLLPKNKSVVLNSSDKIVFGKIVDDTEFRYEFEMLASNPVDTSDNDDMIKKQWVIFSVQMEEQRKQMELQIKEKEQDFQKRFKELQFQMQQQQAVEKETLEKEITQQKQEMSKMFELKSKEYENAKQKLDDLEQKKTGMELEQKRKELEWEQKLDSAIKKLANTHEQNLERLQKTMELHELALYQDKEKMMAEITCDFCQDVICSPYMLACGHGGCHQCLFDWMKEMNTSDDLCKHKDVVIHCFKCRQPLVHHVLAPVYNLNNIIEDYFSTKATDDERNEYQQRKNNYAKWKSDLDKTKEKKPKKHKKRKEQWFVFFLFFFLKKTYPYLIIKK